MHFPLFSLRSSRLLAFIVATFSLWLLLFIALPVCVPDVFHSHSVSVQRCPTSTTPYDSYICNGVDLRAGDTFTGIFGPLYTLNDFLDVKLSFRFSDVSGASLSINTVATVLLEGANPPPGLDHVATSALDPHTLDYAVITSVHERAPNTDLAFNADGSCSRSLTMSCSGSTTGGGGSCEPITLLYTDSIEYAFYRVSITFETLLPTVAVLLGDAAVTASWSAKQFGIFHLALRVALSAATLGALVIYLRALRRVFIAKQTASRSVDLASEGSSTLAPLSAASRCPLHGDARKARPSHLVALLELPSAQFWALLLLWGLFCYDAPLYSLSLVWSSVGLLLISSTLQNAFIASIVLFVLAGLDHVLRRVNGTAARDHSSALAAVSARADSLPAPVPASGAGPANPTTAVLPCCALEAATSVRRRFYAPKVAFAATVWFVLFLTDCAYAYSERIENHTFTTGTGNVFITHVLQPTLMLLAALFALVVLYLISRIGGEVNGANLRRKYFTAAASAAASASALRPAVVEQQPQEQPAPKLDTFGMAEVESSAIFGASSASSLPSAALHELDDRHPISSRFFVLVVACAMGTIFLLFELSQVGVFSGSHGRLFSPSLADYSPFNEDVDSDGVSSGRAASVASLCLLLLAPNMAVLAVAVLLMPSAPAGLSFRAPTGFLGKTLSEKLWRHSAYAPLPSARSSTTLLQDEI
jgi:hypothetical protein